VVLVDIWEGTEPRPEVERFCEMWGIKGPILLDPNLELAEALGVRGVRYDGLPWGYELASLVGAIVEAGRLEPSLRPESLAALGELDRDLTLDVFVTPT
jgi:alkyl hydroperoxide reductase subunit AhpF